MPHCRLQPAHAHTTSPVILEERAWQGLAASVKVRRCLIVIVTELEVPAQYMAALQGSLLPPSAAGPSVEEISFRRLLKKCGDVADGDWKGKAELRSWRTSVLFHHVRPRRCLATLHPHSRCREQHTTEPLVIVRSM